MNLFNLGLELETKIQSPRKTGHTTAGEKEGAPARNVAASGNLWSMQKGEGHLSLTSARKLILSKSNAPGSRLYSPVPPETNPAWQALISAS